VTGYLLVKWVHILSSTVLFGTGAGIAFFFVRGAGQIEASIEFIEDLLVPARPLTVAVHSRIVCWPDSLPEWRVDAAERCSAAVPPRFGGEGGRFSGDGCRPRSGLLRPHQTPRIAVTHSPSNPPNPPPDHSRMLILRRNARKSSSPPRLRNMGSDRIVHIADS
jgi:hypothetical protein